MEMKAAAPRCQLLLILLMSAVMLLPGSNGSLLLVQRTVIRTIVLQETIAKKALSSELKINIVLQKNRFYINKYSKHKEEAKMINHERYLHLNKGPRHCFQFSKSQSPGPRGPAEDCDTSGFEALFFLHLGWLLSAGGHACPNALCRALFTVYKSDYTTLLLFCSIHLNLLEM
ncbi:hypothetical protein STEG23_024714 [Scotinomys teguina]